MSEQSTYLVLLGLSCVFSIIILCAAIIVFYLLRKQNNISNHLKKEKDELKEILSKTGALEVHEIQKIISELNNKKTQIASEIDNTNKLWEKTRQDINNKEKQLDDQLKSKSKEIIILDDEVLLQSFGFYKPRYALQNTETYKLRLDQIRNKQEEMVKKGQASLASNSWTVNNSKKEGERMTKDYVKLILRSFNNECDASIINVKFTNVDMIERKIKKAFEVLNNLGRRMTISISNDYLQLKLQELYLVYEYQVKKQEEKEEQKRLREQMREEAKVLKEIEDVRNKIEKEEKHFNIALEEINKRIANTQTESEKGLLEKEKEEIQKLLIEVEKDKKDIQNRENNTRAGYVYIISNLGSFGENIYKIGVTRRLDPTERVDELGDASVPFDFDIHATIFSEDAPALEYALHKAFEKRRLNWINNRREFFNVSLEEIEKVVKENFSKPIEITKLADAEEYRQSIKLRESL
jgi:hypothetical protein